MMISEGTRTGASESRKITKSTMEKKRRARINTSLIELKSILAGIISLKGERFDKMEKADILEMTVQYVKQLQGRSNTKEISQVDGDYKHGVNSCISEVINCIGTGSMCSTDLKTKLLSHLADRVTADTTTLTSDNISPSQSPQFLLQTVNDNKVINTEKEDFDTDMNNNSESNNITSTTHDNLRFIIPDTQGTKNGNPLTNAVPLQQATLVQQQTPQFHQQYLHNMPFTILLPANLCSPQSGTTCVIPLTIPAGSQHTPLNAQYEIRPQIPVAAVSPHLQTSPNSLISISPTISNNSSVKSPTIMSPMRVCTAAPRTNISPYSRPRYDERSNKPVMIASTEVLTMPTSEDLSKASNTASNQLSDRQISVIHSNKNQQVSLHSPKIANSETSSNSDNDSHICSEMRSVSPDTPIDYRVSSIPSSNNQTQKEKHFVTSSCRNLELNTGFDVDYGKFTLKKDEHNTDSGFVNSRYSSPNVSFSQIWQPWQ